MSMRTLLLSAAMVTALTWSSARAVDAQTQNPDRVVYFTFTQPVTVPGATLPAGKYRFQVLESKSDRGILRIDNADSSKHFTTVLVVPVYGNNPVQTPELRFLETGANNPPALGSYWMPATGVGWEFVYPKDQATELAINTKRPMLSSAYGSTPEELSAASLSSVSASGQAGAYEASKTPISVSGRAVEGSYDDNAAAAKANESVSSSASANASATPSAGYSASGSASASTPAVPSRVASSASSSTPTMARSAQNDAAANANAQNSVSRSDRSLSDRTSLPATAGTSPLAALVGFLALATALGLGVWRRQTA
jgi:hypothetical protein